MPDLAALREEETNLSLMLAVWVLVSVPLDRKDWDIVSRWPTCPRGDDRNWALHACSNGRYEDPDSCQWVVRA